MTTLTFKNNSVSGVDYRAKGVHIEIRGYAEVGPLEVAADVAEKIVADIRRKSPAIQIQVDQAPETETPESPPVAAAEKTGKQRRKSGKKTQKPARKAKAEVKAEGDDNPIAPPEPEDEGVESDSKAAAADDSAEEGIDG